MRGFVASVVFCLLPLGAWLFCLAFVLFFCVSVLWGLGLARVRAGVAGPAACPPLGVCGVAVFPTLVSPLSSCVSAPFCFCVFKLLGAGLFRPRAAHPL